MTALLDFPVSPVLDAAAQILDSESVFVRPPSGAALEAYLALADLHEARAYIRDLVADVNWLIRNNGRAYPVVPWLPVNDLL